MKKYVVTYEWEDIKNVVGIYDDKYKAFGIVYKCILDECYGYEGTRLDNVRVAQECEWHSECKYWYWEIQDGCENSTWIYIHVYDEKEEEE